MISTLSTNIEASIEALLPSYTKLDHVIDIGKNANFKQSNRFGVLVGEGNVVEGVTKAITINQVVDITVTAGYSQPINDAGTRATSNAVADTLITIADHLARSKCGTAGVLKVDLLRVGSTEFLDDNNVLYRTATINVLFRV